MDATNAQTCRTCLAENAANLGLNCIMQNCPSSRTYKEILQELTQIQIMDELEFQMPQNICSSCYKQLQIAYNFIRKSQECNQKLLEMFSKHVQADDGMEKVEYVIVKQEDDEQFLMDMVQDIRNEPVQMSIVKEEKILENEQMEEASCSNINKVVEDYDENSKSLTENSSHMFSDNPCDDDDDEYIPDKDDEEYIPDKEFTKPNELDKRLFINDKLQQNKSSPYSEDCDDSDSHEDVKYRAGSLNDDSDSNDEITKHSAKSSLLRPLGDASTILSDAEPGTSSNDTPLRKRLKKSENSGEYYEQQSNKVSPEHQMKTPCTKSCRLKCSTIFSENERQELFSSYWQLGDLQKQRLFISDCMTTINPAYRYVRVGGRVKGPRKNNNAFYFKHGDDAVRVCKLFFTNTLDINNRVITTVLKKRGKVSDQILEPDRKGKHGKHRKLDPKLQDGVKEFTDKVPKIEDKSLASYCSDSVNICKDKNEPGKLQHKKSSPYLEDRNDSDSHEDVKYRAGSLNDDSDSNDEIPTHSAKSSLLRPLRYAPTILSDTEPGTSSDGTALKKRREKIKNSENYKRNINKKKRNTGEYYELRNNKVRPKRQMKTPCAKSCRLKCSTIFSENERKELFRSYWQLGDLQKQRLFISDCMTTINPKYRYIRVGGRVNGPRQNNSAFYFKRGDDAVRVCRLFFKNTLDITNSAITTVLKKRGKVPDQLLEPDRRGKHGKQRKLHPKIIDGVKEFRDKAPKIKDKTKASYYKDYVKMCKDKNELFCTCTSFYNFFAEDDDCE